MSRRAIRLALLLAGTLAAGVAAQEATPPASRLKIGVAFSGGGAKGCAHIGVMRVFEEMRMAALLQKVRHLDGTRLPAEQAFAMGTVDGGRLLGLRYGGRLRCGGHRVR